MTLLAKVTRAAFDATSKLLGVQLRAEGDEGDDATAAAADEQASQFLPQLGIAVRPVVARTLRALGVEVGDEVLVLKLWDKTKCPTDLAVGETRTFACGDVTINLQMRTDGVTLTAKGATITINASGDVAITPASGRDLVLNGGSLKVARATDAVDLGTWTHTPASGVGVTPCVLSYLPPGGGGGVISAGTAVTGAIAAGAGAPNVKA